MTPQQKILIVDDRPDNLMVLEQTLASVDADVIRAESGNQALTACLNHDFALAILDVQMPGMDGYELASLLRDDPKTAHLPIVFLTATHPEEQQIFRGYEAGAVDYIVKPYEPRVLLSKAGVFLELANQRAELERHRERLEELVEERTRELAAANETLQGELIVRQRAEEALRDLTDTLERRVEARTSELRAANRELEAFTHSVSHDLRGPVRAIDGFTKMVLDEHAEELDPEGARLLNLVRESSKHLGVLVEDLLKLSRLGRQALEPRQLDMEALAEGMVKELEGQDPEGWEVSLGPLPPAWGDQGLIQQVWVNLLSNAVKFSAASAPGLIEIQGSVEGEESVYWVKDNGVGFDMAHAEKLFNVFERLHSREEFEGTGVGLSIVKRIVERHGGRIWAEGKVGEGATFWFALPNSEEQA